MDPNANLAEQRTLAESVVIGLDGGPDTWSFDAGGRAQLCTDAVRLAELVQALDTWISSGGFLPGAWDGHESKIDGTWIAGRDGR